MTKFILVKEYDAYYKKFVEALIDVSRIDKVTEWHTIDSEDQEPLRTEIILTGSDEPIMCLQGIEYFKDKLL
jgi:hypothetical protein